MGENKPASTITSCDVCILVEITLESGRFGCREGGGEERLVMIGNWRIWVRSSMGERKMDRHWRRKTRTLSSLTLS